MSPSTQSTSFKVEERYTILTSQEAWDSWIAQMRFKADSDGIWEFIIPEFDEEKIKKVVPPKASEEFLEATFEKMTPQQCNIYGRREKKYFTALKKHKEKGKEVGKIRDFIFSTIPKSSHMYITKLKTVHQMLREFQRRYQPSDFAQRLEITRKYQVLLKGPSSTQEEKWLKQWEVTYDEATRPSLPEVTKEKPLIEFIRSVKALDPN
jgi:hypothetical protein